MRPAPKKGYVAEWLEEQCRLQQLVIQKLTVHEMLAGPVGVDAYLKSWRYGTGGRAWLDTVTLSGIEVPIRFDKDSSVEVYSGAVPEHALQALGAIASVQAP